MKILHRYLVSQYLRNLALCVCIATVLFMIIDFFDRIDNILAEQASLWMALQYFLFKIPLTIHHMLPVAVLVATLFTLAMLSKNSEITAMRASGLKILWLTRPLLVVGIIVSLVSLLLNETIVPYASRRVSEIYNIDIRRKTERGAYSQENFWWRTGENFFSVDSFDSRDNTLHQLSWFKVNDRGEIMRRTMAEKAVWIEGELNLGWNMRNVRDLAFAPDGRTQTRSYKQLPLPIEEKPEYFYNAERKAESLSFRQLSRYMQELSEDGIKVSSYRPELYAKLSFPFVCLTCILVAIPFGIKPARSGNLATSFVAGITIGFSYYLVHALSLALGRGELISPILAAWIANVILASVGAILILGAEAPN